MVNLKSKLIIYELYSKIKSLYIYDNKYSYSFHYCYFNETYKNINDNVLSTKKKISKQEFDLHKFKNFSYINNNQKKIILNMTREDLLKISVHQLIELIGAEEYLI